MKRGKNNLMVVLIVCGGIFMMGMIDTRSRGTVTVEPIGSPEHYSPSEHIRQKEIEQGLEKGMLLAAIIWESGFDEKAFNPEKKSKCYQQARNAKEREECGAYGAGQVIWKWHKDHPLLKGKTPMELNKIQVAIEVAGDFLGEKYRQTRNRLQAWHKYNGAGDGSYEKNVERVFAGIKKYAARG